MFWTDPVRFNNYTMPQRECYVNNNRESFVALLGCSTQHCESCSMRMTCKTHAKRVGTVLAPRTVVAYQGATTQ